MNYTTDVVSDGRTDGAIDYVTVTQRDQHKVNDANYYVRRRWRRRVTVSEDGQKVK